MMSPTTGQGANTARVMSLATRMVASIISPLARNFSDRITSICCQSDGSSHQNIGIDRRSGGTNHWTTDIICLTHQTDELATKWGEGTHCVFL